MKFDGAKYLETKIKENFNINNSINKYCEIFHGENSSIGYGDLEIRKVGDKKYIRSFTPNCQRNIKIYNVEIGGANDRLSGGCVASFQARFIESPNSLINCVINLANNSDGTNAKAVVVIRDEKDPYRGIYYIKMNQYDHEKNKPKLSYFDGDVLDVLDRNHDIEEVNKLIGLSPEKLEDLGFSPDKERIYEKVEVCGNYGFYDYEVAYTFINGNLDLFKEWVSKSFKEVKEDEKRGPILRRNRRG